MAHSGHAATYLKRNEFYLPQEIPYRGISTYRILTFSSKLFLGAWVTFGESAIMLRMNKQEPIWADLLEQCMSRFTIVMLGPT